MGDIYLWRQIFILMTNMFFAVTIGNLIAFPSVFTPTLSSNNTDIEVTPNQLSWIATSNGVGGIFGFMMLSSILQIFGRKVVHIFDCLVVLIGWITFLLAHSFTALLAARIIQGLAFGGIYIHAMILSEYSAPSRRGYFITIKKATLSIGVLMLHSLSLIWNWRQIATFATIFPTLSMIFTLFWPESPFYLAMKGRFKDSEKSFIWLHGDSNLQELKLLHYSQQQRAKNLNTEKWHKFLFKTDFVKSFVIVSFLTMVIELSGKHYLAVYIIQMMIELVGDKSLALYLTIGTDIFVVVASMFSCIIISSFKRRTVLFSGGVTVVFLMITICVVEFLKLATVPWLAPSLLVLHCFIANISIIPVGYTFIGELLPLEYKGWGSFLAGIVSAFLYTVLIKITPLIIENVGVGGVFATYGITIAVCLLILYFIVPETRDKTLTEIENKFKNVEVSISEESKRLEMID